MRFLVPEQPYERPLSAGQLRYEQDGQTTGAVESWRWTQGTAGYHILRVDLDARAAPSGHSYIYHLVQQENGRFEQLKYRFWADGLQLSGNVLLEDAEIVATREVYEQYVTEETAVSPGYRFWFPSSVGLGLLAEEMAGAETAVTISTISLQAPTGATTLTTNPPWPFGLIQPTISRTWGQPHTATLARQTLTIRPLTLRWSDKTRTLWLDPSGLVVKMEREDGLTAVVTRLIHYQI